MKVGQKVSWNSSGGTASGIIRQVVRSGTVPDIPVKINASEDEPAARIEITDDEGKPTGTMVGHKISTLRKLKFTKYQLSTDVFSNKMEAESRSIDMGFGQTSHAYEVDGQAYYMPAASHEAYMSYFSEPDDLEPEYPSPDKMEVMTEALSAVVDAIMGSIMKGYVTKEVKADILKVDVDERIVWGWAYVSTVKGVRSVDHSQESVSPEVLVKAATNFMLSVRTAKAMHQGGSVGEVVHSFPLTNELGKSLGVSSDREGWIICMKIHDEKVWQSVKSGELSAFSIGGRALRRSLE